MTRPCDLWSEAVGCDVTNVAPVVVERSLALATNVLWALSGRRYGVCETKIRPCRQEEWGDYGSHLAPWVPVSQYAGPASWPNAWLLNPLGRVCGSSCGCTELEEIRLPHRPVRSIVEVRLDGVALDPSSYRVDDYRYLVRLDGEWWPTCQDLAREDTEEGTFSVTYTYGNPVPEGGAYAAERLACELVRAMIGDEECALPSRLQTLSRQGITMSFIDPMDFLDKGRVGITEVDLWLRAVNPNGLQRRSRMYRADALPLGRRVGT